MSLQYRPEPFGGGVGSFFAAGKIDEACRKNDINQVAPVTRDTNSAEVARRMSTILSAFHGKPITVQSDGRQIASIDGFKIAKPAVDSKTNPTAVAKNHTDATNKPPKSEPTAKPAQPPVQVADAKAKPAQSQVKVADAQSKPPQSQVKVADARSQLGQQAARITEPKPAQPPIRTTETPALVTGSSNKPPADGTLLTLTGEQMLARVPRPPSTTEVPNLPESSRTRSVASNASDTSTTAITATSLEAAQAVLLPATEILPQVWASPVKTGDLPKGVFAPAPAKRIDIPAEFADGKAGVNIDHMKEVDFGVGKLEIGFNDKNEAILIRGRDTQSNDNKASSAQVKLDRESLDKLGMTKDMPGWYHLNNDKQGPAYQRMLDGTRYSDTDQTYIAQYDHEHAKLWTPGGQVIEGKVNALGAFVQADKDGQVQLIVRSDNSKVIPTYSEAKDADGNKSLVRLTEIDANGKSQIWNKEGTSLILREDNGNITGVRQDCVVHQNGNLTFKDTFNDKAVVDTIVRGDGTVLHTGTGMPQYEFDNEGRFSKIANNDRTRQFEYIGHTNQLAKVTVQASAYPDLTFTHELQANSNNWTCVDQYNRRYAAPQGVHELYQSSGQYTFEGYIGQGSNAKKVFHVSNADGTNEYQQLLFHQDGSTVVRNYNASGIPIPGERTVDYAKDKSINNLINVWENTHSLTRVGRIVSEQNTASAGLREQTKPAENHTTSTNSALEQRMAKLARSLEEFSPQTTATTDASHKPSTLPRVQDISLSPPAVNQPDKSTQALHLLDYIKDDPRVPNFRSLKEQALIETKHDKTLLADINGYRAKNGLQKLTFDPAVKLAALVNSEAQCRNGLSHKNGPQGWQTPQQRIQQVGRQPAVGGSTAWIENAAQGADAHQTFKMWEASPPHRAAMLNPNGNLAGIALARAANGTYYSTFDVAKGKPVDQSILPNQIATTTNRKVVEQTQKPTTTDGTQVANAQAASRVAGKREISFLPFLNRDRAIDNSPVPSRGNYDDLIVVNKNAPPARGFREKVIAELDHQSDSVINELYRRNTKIQLGRDLPSLGAGNYEGYDALSDYTGTTIRLTSRGWNGDRAGYVARTLNHELGHYLFKDGGEAAADIYAAKMAGRAAYTYSTLAQLKEMHHQQGTLEFFNKVMNRIENSQFSRSLDGSGKGAKEYHIARK